MTKESAMSTSATWDCQWESLSDSELEEWLLIKDEDDKRDVVNDPSLILNKCETAKQSLDHIDEDLCKEDNDYWLEEFPLFDEIESTIPFEDLKSQDFAQKQKKEISPVPYDIYKPCATPPNLFSTSSENSTDIIVSNDNILYINGDSFKEIATSECFKTIKYYDDPSPPEKSDQDLDFYSKATLDVKTEMAVVDEIIRSTALELDQWESDTSRSESCSEGTYDSSSSKEREEETDDPEWTPEPWKSSGRRGTHCRKSKPYCRGASQEEKKLRKKEQNKNAATRYRQKKKAEVSEILREETELKEKKAKLEEKVFDIQNEIKYLKGLMRDLFRAKGLIN